MKTKIHTFFATFLIMGMLLQATPAYAAWTVVYMAPSTLTAQRIVKLFQDDKILVKSRLIRKSPDNSDNYYEILVQDNEVECAHSVIIENGF